MPAPYGTLGLTAELRRERPPRSSEGRSSLRPAVAAVAAVEQVALRLTSGHGLIKRSP